MDQTQIQFKSRIFVSGQLIVKTGMHIGGNSTEMGIGGADSIVVRDPVSNYPYIPGSSFRGKMRSLLEKLRGEINIHTNSSGNIVGDPSQSPEDTSAKLFGVAVDKMGKDQFLPQRLLVRDAFLDKESAEQLDQAPNTDMPFTEVKTEVAIDRVTSKANPRQIERVPAGARFNFQIILNLYAEDEEEHYINLLFECLNLLQDDYLGGHGSRGYGRVKFNVQELSKKTADDYRNIQEPKSIEGVEIPESLKIKEEPCLATS